MATLIKTKPATDGRRNETCVTDAVRSTLDACPYRFVFNNVKFDYDEGLLTLRGRVPSFYLKQVLQNMMIGFDQVEQIANHVQVVSTTGLSTEPRNMPPK